jgi:hypothetical protein
MRSCCGSFSFKLVSFWIEEFSFFPHQHTHTHTYLRQQHSHTLDALRPVLLSKLSFHVHVGIIYSLCCILLHFPAYFRRQKTPSCVVCMYLCACVCFLLVANAHTQYILHTSLHIYGVYSPVYIARSHLHIQCMSTCIHIRTYTVHTHTHNINLHMHIVHANMYRNIYIYIYIYIDIYI